MSSTSARSLAKQRTPARSVVLRSDYKHARKEPSCCTAAGENRRPDLTSVRLDAKDKEQSERDEQPKKRRQARRKPSGSRRVVGQQALN